MSKESIKMDILLGLIKKGYNLQDTEESSTMSMELGNGYTLLASVKSNWLITFKDGNETVKYQIDSTKVPYSNAKDARTLHKEFQAACAALAFEGADDVESVEESVPEETETVSEPSNWSEGGFNKMKHSTPDIKETESEFEEDDIEECSPTPEQERIFNSVPVRSGSIVQRRPSRTIKGLTPILAECGKIKIGKKGKIIKSRKGTDFRPPERMDHFEITTMDKNDNDDFVLDGYIMAKIGANARELNVRLPYDDPSLNFYTSYSKYEGSACKCRGDGELAISNHKIIQCNPEQCEYYIKNKCKPNGILSLILDDAPRVGGVYKFRTVGWNSINNVYSSMEFIRGLTNGLLAGLPLVLTLTPKHVTIPETSKRTVIYMVNLEYRGSLQDMVTAIQQTISTRSMMQYSVKDFEKLAEEMILLPEAPDECKDIIAEFYPDEVQA